MGKAARCFLGVSRRQAGVLGLYREKGAPGPGCAAPRPAPLVKHQSAADDSLEAGRGGPGAAPRGGGGGRRGSPARVGGRGQTAPVAGRRRPQGHRPTSKPRAHTSTRAHTRTRKHTHTTMSGKQWALKSFKQRGDLPALPRRSRGDSGWGMHCGRGWTKAAMLGTRRRGPRAPTGGQSAPRWGADT